MRSLKRQLITVAVAVTLCFTFGCAKTVSETSKTASPLAPATIDTRPVQSSQPKPNEIATVVKRIFKDATAPDSQRTPNFVVGDFNGDGSQDIAVVVTPVSGKLTEMNQEFPPWILKDPFTRPMPGLPPPQVKAGEALLAVVHGYGHDGWRDSQATQTYLLKNAVGGELKTINKSEFQQANQGKATPRLVGDLIAEDLRGQPGYLYFAGPTYSWYDPKTFRAEPELRVVHPGMSAPKGKFDLLNLKVRRPAAEKRF